MENNFKGNRLRELTHEETLLYSGGMISQIVRAVIVSAIGAIVNDWDNFKRGLTGRPEI